MVPDFDAAARFLWICGIAAGGAIINYLLWKKHRKKSHKLSSMGRYAFFGFFSGMLLCGFTESLGDVSWLQTIPVAAFWGAQWEFMLAMYLNRGNGSPKARKTKPRRPEIIGPCITTAVIHQ